MKKRGLLLAAAAVAILILILVVVPLPIVNGFRPRIESEASSALGRPVTVGSLGLSILSGTVEADNVAIADDPAFSRSPFVTARSLKIGVELIPLIFSKQLNVTEIILKEPQITLLRTANGIWNYSSLGSAARKPRASGESAATNLSVAKLKIEDGKLLIGKANSPARAKVYDKVNITVTDFSATSQFPFELTANLPGGGSADMGGKAGPIDAADAAKTPLGTTVKVEKMDLAASGFIDPASGIAGIANFDGTLTSNGSRARAVGTFTGTQLKLSPKGTPAPNPVVVKHVVDFNLNNQTGTLTQGDLSIGEAHAQLTGTFRTEGETQVVDLKLNAPDMPVEQLEAMLPSLGIVLPAGSQLVGGTLSANLAITGPVDKLVIAGPVKLSNTSLAHFDLGAKMGALSAFAGKAGSSPDTSIRNLSLNARITPAVSQADDINLDVPAVGVITGAGTVSPAGALNFQMVANLSGGMLGGLGQMAASFSGKNGVPFAIEGTTANPKFVPQLQGLAAGLATGAVKGFGTGKATNVQGTVTNTLGQFFGKKK